MKTMTVREFLSIKGFEVTEGGFLHRGNGTPIFVMGQSTSEKAIYVQKGKFQDIISQDEEFILNEKLHKAELVFLKNKTNVLFGVFDFDVEKELGTIRGNEPEETDGLQIILEQIKKLNPSLSVEKTSPKTFSVQSGKHEFAITSLKKSVRIRYISPQSEEEKAFILRYGFKFGIITKDGGHSVLFPKEDVEELVTTYFNLFLGQNNLKESSLIELPTVKMRILTALQDSSCNSQDKLIKRMISLFQKSMGSGNLSRYLGKLEKEGLVLRGRLTNRGKSVWITDEGKKLLK